MSADVYHDIMRTHTEPAPVPTKQNTYREPLRPPFAYYGGKTKLAQTIADALPTHEHYIEPYAGSLAVLLAKQPSEMETVNDIDGDLVNFWRVLRDRPDDLTRAAMFTPHSREEYATAHDISGDELERARRVFVLLTQGRSHSLKPTGWKVQRSANVGFSRPEYQTAYAARMIPAAERMAGVSLENIDAIEMIKEYGSEPTVCIYADPPYLGSTRTANYKYEMRGDDLHEKLAGALNDCKASVVLSGYASPLYEELFNGWHRTEMKAPQNLAAGASQNEILWSNVPLGEPDLFGSASMTYR